MDQVVFEPTTIFKKDPEMTDNVICPIILKIPRHMDNVETEEVVKQEVDEMLKRIKVALPDWER